MVTIGNNTSVSGRGVVMGLQLVPLPTRLYADATAAAGGDGLSWATAFNNLQDALAAATAFAPAVAEIWVADGTYTPDTGINRSAAFNLRNGVALIGGFAGGETDVNDRDEFTHRAFLSGGINTASNLDNSYHVMRASSTDATAVVDGFWFTSGYANGRRAAVRRST